MTRRQSDAATRRNKTKDKFQSTRYKKPFAKKSFGQNFLVDGSYIEKIIAALNPQPNETIIEIGAGRGALTRKLIEKAVEVLAIEFDRDLIPVLKNEFGDCDNFQLIESDALTVDFRRLLQESKHQSPKSKIVANLPYYISTAILQKLIEQHECFSELVLMLQREVVERITAKAGNSERGFLSVLIEAYAYAEKLFDVPPTAFSPVPKVWSSVVRLEIKDSRLITSQVEDKKIFWQIVSAGFAQKRKTILNNLKNAPSDLHEIFSKKRDVNQLLELAEIDSQRRAETLTLQEWKRICKAVLSN